jgi:penicillin-binding protein 1A
VRVTPRLLRKVSNADGITLWEQAPAVNEVTSQETARTMMRLLREVIRAGTGGAASQLKHPLGGKTGTTSDYTDAWFMGFSPSITCGVWVGFDSRQSLGEKETGAKAALPIWMNFMREAIKGKDDEHFIGDAATVAKPDVVVAAGAVPGTVKPAGAPSPRPPAVPETKKTAAPLPTGSNPSSPAQLPAQPVSATPKTPASDAPAKPTSKLPLTPSLPTKPAMPSTTQPPGQKPAVKPALPQISHAGP